MKAHDEATRALQIPGSAIIFITTVTPWERLSERHQQVPVSKNNMSPCNCPPQMAWLAMSGPLYPALAQSSWALLLFSMGWTTAPVTRRGTHSQSSHLVSVFGLGYQPAVDQSTGSSPPLKFCKLVFSLACVLTKKSKAEELDPF